jgi:hypothetical protein
MNVCANCFTELELKAFIESSGVVGECSVTGSSSEKVIVIDELMDFFTELVENFEESDSGQPILELLQSKWSFFANNEIGSQILDEVLTRIGGKIFNSQTAVSFSTEITENLDHWTNLKEEIKWDKRFTTDVEYLKKSGRGWDALFHSRFKLLTPDDSLYRARLHYQADDEAFSTDNMSCPPREKVGDGRANPIGIPFLYLSLDSETPLYEVRATLFDELSVGEFKLAEGINEIKIVDFTETTPLFSPTDFSISSLIKFELLKREISQDLSKPMRKYDSIVEYVPTQFICEFIKTHTAAGGIQFKSSVTPAGKNIVIFDPEKIQCVEVTVKRITKLVMNAVVR